MKRPKSLFLVYLVVAIITFVSSSFSFAGQAKNIILMSRA